MSENKHNEKKALPFAHEMCRGYDPRAFTVITNGYYSGNPDLSFQCLVGDRDEFGNTCLHHAVMDLSDVATETGIRKSQIADFLLALTADPFAENNDLKRPVDLVPQDIAEMFGLPYIKPSSPYIRGVAFENIAWQARTVIPQRPPIRPAGRQDGPDHP